MEASKVYKNILELQSQKNKIEEQIRSLKKELDDLMVSEREPEIKIVYLPEFVQKEDVVSYVQERFPTYEIVSISEEPPFSVKISELDSYIPKKMEFEDGGQAYRRISKGRPSIDLNVLQSNYPEIFSKIITLVPEIDESKVDALIEEDPSTIDILEATLKMESPSVAIVVSKSRKAEQ